MNLIFEKTIDVNHANYKMVDPITEHIFSENDYSEKELDLSNEYINNVELTKYKKLKYESYKNWGFPVWKRAKLKGFNPPKYEIPIAEKITGEVKKIDKINIEGLEILLKYDFEGAHRKFLLMSDVFFNTGFYYDTEEGEEKKVVIEQDLEKTIIENNVFNVKENSKLTVFRILRKSEKKGFKNASIRGMIEQNAELNIININLLGDEDINIDNALFDVKDNATLNIYDFNIGGKIASPFYFVRLSGKNSKCNIKPYFFGDENNIIDMLYLLRFYGKESIGRIAGKGIIKGSSKAVFRGFLDIKKGAKEANASEEEYTLVLSENAKAEAIPNLLVDENEVNASHAASVGTIDEQKLYYLMTRGFSKSEAKKLIAFGIFEPILDEIEIWNKNICEEMKNEINRRL